MAAKNRRRRLRLHLLTQAADSRKKARKSRRSSKLALVKIENRF